MKRPPAKRTTNWKRKALLDRIKHLDDGIAKCREYLKTGGHADWGRFRPLFTKKFAGGRELPPHPDWVKNFLLPNLERALSQAEKLFERLGEKQ